MVERPSVAGADRRDGKSAAAFRTISEVAGELEVPQHVLRFWETRFSQIRPLKRGGGRRYYRPDDVALLRRIRTLLYTNGYTIKGVQKLLREGAAGAASGDGAGSGAAPRAGAKGALAPGPRAEVEAALAELRAVRDLLKRAP
ncbi:MAG: MerR family transcriptional regulator [Proteobacteria bacterium]|nr:MerR family transcriptional regulator [Pseudomonadota bacterium]